MVTPRRARRRCSSFSTIGVPRGYLAASERLRDDANVGPWRLPALRVLLLGFLVADRAGDDDVFARIPIHRRRHLVPGGELQGIDDTQQLVEIAAGRHRIDQDESDLLVGPMTKTLRTV